MRIRNVRPNRLIQNGEKPILAAILLLAAFLTCWGIWNEGYGNEYYTAAVKSMTMSWHNFFFASFDPGGFITIDKPAPGLWLQCLFALVFGVHGWSVILPEALCSVASVWVLYRIVKRGFDRAAGLLAALLLALTPIFIAASRSNNLDAALVLVCLLSVWAVLRAAEEGSLKYLLLSMALLGVGFNIKTLQAYMYLPALYLVYFFAANATLKKRILQLGLATAVLLVVSLSWAATVDLIPASERPYIGSSTTNSELELAIGYNGLDRALPSSLLNLLGRGDASSEQSVDSDVNDVISSGSGIPNEGGEAGLLRMFNTQMAGQASWIIVFALFGILSLFLDAVTRPKGERKPVSRQLLCWAGLFVPMYALFSVSGHFHRYYLIMFAPCIAALSAIGLKVMWSFYARRGITGTGRVLHWLLPIAIAVTAGVQISIVSDYSACSRILIPIIVSGSVTAVIGLTVCRIIGRERQRFAKLFAAVGLAALLAAPAYWSLTPITYDSNASIPVAGPSGTASMPDGGKVQGSGADNERRQNAEVPGARGEMPDERGFMPNGNLGPGVPEFGGNSGDDLQYRIKQSIDGMGGGMRASLSDSMIEYMMNNYDGERYLLAVPNAGSAEEIIIKYGVGVMALGGFKGTDNAISLDDFIKLVENGELRFYWAGGGLENNEITSWIEENGRLVSDSVINRDSYTASTSGLYDLSGLKAAK